MGHMRRTWGGHGECRRTQNVTIFNFKLVTQIDYSVNVSIAMFFEFTYTKFYREG